MSFLLRSAVASLAMAVVPAHAAAQAAAAPVVAFDPASLQPYFEGGALAKASERLRSGDAVAAQALITEYVVAWRAERSAKRLDAKDDALDAKVRFLLGLTMLKAAEQLPIGPERTTTAQGAAQHFVALAKSYPLLGTYHALYSAQALLIAGKPQASLTQLAGVPSDSVLDCEARFLRGDALRNQAEQDKAKTASLKEQSVAAYRAYLAACGDHGRHKRAAQVQTASLLDGLGRSAEALQIWRRLYIEAPTEAVSAQAARRLEQPGTKQAPFSASELLERAQILFDEMRNPESEAAFLLVLEQPDLDDKQKCIARYHVAQSVFKQRQRPRAAPLFDLAVAACAPSAAKNDDLHMKSLYQGARCHASAGRLQKSADLFAQAEAEHSMHSYADDARLRQAEMYLDLAERVTRDGAKKTCDAAECPDYEAKCSALLAELPTRFPDGDRRAEALWRLAFRALRKKDLQTAKSWLTTALDKIPREVGWDQEGRTLYWLGRVAELSGDRSVALTRYQQTARTYPLSFYTLLSLNRLRVGFATEFSALLGELYGDPHDEPMQFAPRALYSLPGFLRGIELLRLGLGSEARREFASVGIVATERNSDKSKERSSDKSNERSSDRSNDAPERELLWLASVLYERAGDWYHSHWIPRHILTDWQSHYPVGKWRSQWLLAYPRGYAELLTSAAQQNGHPEALQFAIVREESAFDPLTESFANAIGLTQMIPPTAKRFSNGLPYDRAALRDPATNVAIGSRFLGFLWQTMNHHPSLTISSYNAGEGAVWRWLRQYADLQEIDLFVESIPYDETRGYTKRVLSSFLTYRWLQPLPSDASLSVRVPEIPFALPPPPASKTRPASAATPSVTPAPSAASTATASEKSSPASAAPPVSGDAKPAETPR